MLRWCRTRDLLGSQITARHYRSLKRGSMLKYINIIAFIFIRRKKLSLMFYCKNLPYSLKNTGLFFIRIERLKFDWVWWVCYFHWFSVNLGFCETGKQGKGQKWRTNVAHHCRQEPLSSFSLFLNLPCFVLLTFYATWVQGIVLEMFLYILVNRILIKRALVCKNQPNNTCHVWYVSVFDNSATLINGSYRLFSLSYTDNAKTLVAFTSFLLTLRKF